MCRYLRHKAFTPLLWAAGAALLFPAAPAAQEKSYRIAPEDVVTIVIYAGGEKQHESDATVSAEGLVDAPFVGPVRAGGLTPSALEAKLAEPLGRDYFVDPKVNVRVKGYHGLSYYISGAVQSPGIYEMRYRASLLELIVRAGGVAQNAGAVALIQPRAGADPGAGDGEDAGEPVPRREPVRIDLAGLLEKGDQTQNPVLEPGDMVYIPPKEALNVASSKIYVEGEVGRPGLYDYQPGMTALNACILAGGFVKFSAPNRAKIIRRKGDAVEVIKINLSQVQDGKIPDVELQPGDRVHIPESWL